jgi:anti-anti-sigma factor
VKEDNLRWPLRVTQERRDGVLILALAGRVGFESADAFAATVAEAMAKGHRNLVVDLASVDYVSSAGLKALETAAARCVEIHGTFVLCALTEPVRVALDLAGLLSQLLIALTRDNAVALAGQTPD